MKQAVDQSFLTPFYLSVVILAMLFAWQYWLLLETAGGLFSYVLDDAYIHLALSENLMKGHYGVNLEEYSAPSSSILWSFLMAPVAQWQWSPLVVNIALSGLGLYLWNAQIQRFFPGREFATLTFALNISFIAFANLIGVTFTGMENVLQMVIALGICSGCFQLLAHNAPSKWLILAIIIAPLARYETITLSCLALALLFCKGHRILALATALAMLAPLVGFSLYLDSLGLGLLPSSISAKSTALQSSALKSTLLNLYDNLYEPSGTLLLALLLPFVWRGLQLWRKNPLITLLTLILAGAVVAHLALARLGNWGRYEVYIWVSLLVSLLYVFQRPIRGWFRQPEFSRAFAYLALACFTVIGAKRSIVTSLSNHIGGANIALQQYQMHRFTTEFWKKPVAVNDLGWVAYNNDHYVLDLWGLANHEALEMRQSNTPNFLDALTNQHNVKLAMVYKDWFSKELLQHWTLVGELHFPEDLRRMTSAERHVQFYATDDDAVFSIRSQLKRFAQTIPGGARMELLKQ